MNTRNVNNVYEKMFRWCAHKLKIQDRFIKNSLVHVKIPRGTVYTCYMGINIGHEKSRLEARPCLVVSSDRINYNSSNVIVVPLSKDIKYKQGSTTELRYDWHYVLKKIKYTSLQFDSVVQCEDIRCVSKTRLGSFVTKVDSSDMKEIKKRLKSTLQL